MRAKLLGTYKGKRVYRWPVEITFGERAASPQATIDDWLDLPTVKTDVIAFTAQEAGDWVCDRVCEIPCVTLTVYGPKGGKAVHRYWGHDQAIWFGMQKATEGRQQEIMVNI